MSTNAPPRAPGELAEIEALIDELIDELIRTSESAATAYLLGSTGDEHEANEEQKRARAALVTSLRSATGDGGEAMRAGAPFTPNYSAVAEPEYRYQEPDNRACSMALQPRSTKIEGADEL